MASPSLDIDINNIFYQLHEAALENSKDLEIEIYNTGVDEQAKTYTGSGEYFICASSTDPDSLSADLDKTQAFEVLKKYVQFFCGDETASNLDEKMLMPIKEGEKVQRRKDGEKDDVSEAITYDYSLLTQLFDSDQEEDDGTFVVLNEADKKVVGYLLPYLASIKKEKPKPANIGRKRLLNHFKKLGRWTLVTGLPSLASMPFSLLGKLAGALPGIVVKTGSGDFDTRGATQAVGKGLDATAKGIKKAGELGGKAYDYVKGNLEIDLTSLESNVSQAFDKDYPSNDVHPRVYKVTTLTQILRQQQKFSNKIKARLESAGEYCLGILVSSDDINYDQYNKEVIAIEVTKGIALQNPSMFSNKISKDQVLKVAGYDVRSRVKNKKIFYETKTTDEICNDLVGFLFEATLSTSDAKPVEYSEAATKIINLCPDKRAFWNSFESDTTVPDKKIATDTKKTKKELRQYFERSKSLENAVKRTYQTSQDKARAFLKLVKKLALKLGVKVPKSMDPTVGEADPKKPQFDAPQTTTDLYIVIHKGMTYPDKDDESRSKR